MVYDWAAEGADTQPISLVCRDNVIDLTAPSGESGGLGGI